MTPLDAFGAAQAKPPVYVLPCGLPMLAASTDASKKAGHLAMHRMRHTYAGDPVNEGGNKGKPRTSERRLVAAAARELRDPLELVRAVRELVALRGRPFEPEEWRGLVQRILVGVAAIDPTLQEMTEAELLEAARRGPRVPEADRGATSGIKHVAHGSLDSRGMLLAARVGEIRTLVTSVAQCGGLAQEGATRLSIAADGLLQWMANPDEPLSQQEQLVWEFLLEQTPGAAVTSARIFEALAGRGHVLSEVVLRRWLSGTLRTRGVRNRPQVGYFIPLECRPSSQGED